MKQRLTLTHQDAMKLIEAARKRLEDGDKGAAVAVVDPHGELIAFLRTEGCPLPSINNAINKAFTAARETKPSKDIGEASRIANFPLTNFGDLRYIGWGGGIPIEREGQIVGAVGVSGLPEAEDMEIAAILVDLVE